MKWFQFHLATALLLTLIAGALLGINLQPGPPTPINDPDYEIKGQSYGWPAVWEDTRLVAKPPQFFNNNTFMPPALLAQALR